MSYQVIAERPGFELDEFVVSDDLSTVAMLWNINGCSELQILATSKDAAATRSRCPAWSPASCRISAGGSMVAMTVEGPSQPPTVELVDTRTLEWEPVDRVPSAGRVRHDPHWKRSPPATG